MFCQHGTGIESTLHVNWRGPKSKTNDYDYDGIMIINLPVRESKIT